MSSALVTQLLMEQLFLLSQQEQPPHCPAVPTRPGRPPLPLGARSQLRGPRAGGGTPPHTPKTGFPLQGRGFPEALRELKARCPAHFGAWGAWAAPRGPVLEHTATRSPRCHLIAPLPAPPSRAAADWAHPVPLHRDCWALGGGCAGSRRGGRGMQTPARLVITACPGPHTRNLSPVGSRGSRSIHLPAQVSVLALLHLQWMRGIGTSSPPGSHPTVAPCAPGDRAVL